MPYPLPSIIAAVQSCMQGGGGQSYADKIIALFGASLIGYWKLDEPSGTAVIDSSPQKQTNGLYSGGVSLANAVSPPGTPAPLFNGTNGVADVFSAGLASDFSGTEITLICWLKKEAHVNYKVLLYFNADSVNYVLLQQGGGANFLGFNYVAGGVSDGLVNLAATDGSWYCLGVTVSATADKAYGYVNGVQSAPHDTLGVWAGTIVGAKLGGFTGAYSNVWLAHCMLLNKAATPAEMLEVYNLGVS